LGGLGERTPDNFKTFDFFDEDRGLATSAKTLETRAPGYADRPSRIFGALKRYIDQIDKFGGGVVGETVILQALWDFTVKPFIYKLLGQLPQCLDMVDVNVMLTEHFLESVSAL
jgi:hypothetical protein|tara:strand:+ start:4060 stop:4401 length:342 start_codon:yes stop_codon:yes gene_type:complete